MSPTSEKPEFDIQLQFAKGLFNFYYAQLFVTTATRGLSEERRQAEPLAGRVIVLDVGVRGFAPTRFGIAPALRAAPVAPRRPLRS